MIATGRLKVIEGVELSPIQCSPAIYKNVVKTIPKIVTNKSSLERAGVDRFSD